MRSIVRNLGLKRQCIRAVVQSESNKTPDRFFDPPSFIRFIGLVAILPLLAAHSFVS